MSRRKQQNPKPLVALKQAEDEADKPSGCEAGSMTQGELLEDEVAGVERDGGLSLGRTEPCCYGSGSGGGSGDDPPGVADSPLASADVSEADGETDTAVVHDADTQTGSQGSSVRSCTAEARLSSAVDRMAAADEEEDEEEEEDAQPATAAEISSPPQEIIKVVWFDDDGEYRVLSRAYVAAGSGCGPFRACHVPTALAGELCRQQPAIEAKLLKFCQGDVVHWYLLEADDGLWLRFLDAPMRCRQAANVAIHYVGKALWLEVTQPLEPNDRLVAELSIDPGSYRAAATAVAAAAAAALPRRSLASDDQYDGLRSEAAARALRETPTAASAAARLSLDAQQADGDDSTAASDGRAEPSRQETGDRERDAHSPDGLAPSTGTQQSDSGSVVADAGSRVKQFGTTAASLSCRTCGVTFRSQRTLEAHQLYYCNQTASGGGAAAATAAPPAAIAPSGSGSPARVTSACSARSSGSSSLVDVKPHLPPLPSTLFQHVPAARDLQPDADRDGSMPSAIGAFQCQLCPQQTSSWPEMCAHVRDHAQIMHQVPLPAPLRCLDSESSVAETAVVAAAAAAFRRPDKRPSALLSADSYCANCDIQFMSAASYDAHRQHYCGSRRGRLQASVDGRNDGTATEASTAASQPPVGQLSAQASEQASLLLSLSRSSIRYLSSAATAVTSTTVAATAAGYDAGADGASATKDRAAAAAATTTATGHSTRSRADAEFPAVRAAVAPGLPAKASKGNALLLAQSVPSKTSRTDAAGGHDQLLISPATTAAATTVARSSVDSSGGGSTGRRGRSPLLQTASASAATPPLQHALTSYSYRPTVHSEEGADGGNGGASSSRHADLATAASSSLTISIPAVLSVPAPLVDGSIVCGDRGSLPGRLIIGPLRSPASAEAAAADAPDVTSLPLEVPASIIQRAVAASQQQPVSLLRSTTRQGSAAAIITAAAAAPASPVLSDMLSPEASQAGQPATPVSAQCRLGNSSRSRSGSAAGSSGREAPLDLSMKCLKRKLPLPAQDGDDELRGERVPAKILAAAYDPISVNMAASGTAAGLIAGGSSLTPVRAPAASRGSVNAPNAVQVPTPGALLSKCVDCNILFYKHENYVAHKTHYCPARHRELSQAAIATASRLDRTACWSNAGGDSSGSSSSSSSSSSMADKYTAGPPTAVVAATPPGAGRKQPAASAATARDSVEEGVTMSAAGLSHAMNSAAIGEAAAASEQRPAAASPTASALDDVSRDGSAADEQRQPVAAVATDDRLVITYTCNKCERSFTTLDHFGKHACSAATAAGSTATGAAVALGASPLLLFTPNTRHGDVDASPRVAAATTIGRPCYGSAVADAATAGESTSALIGALRRCGTGAAATPIGSGVGSGGAVTTASSSAFVCSLCGYHGNTVRGMRLHGRYHIDRGEPWSEACITDNGQRVGCGGSATSLATHLPSASAAAGVLACGASTPTAGPLHLQQPSPHIEEELLRLKNEPYKKRKSRKSYQLFCAATAAAAAAAATSVAAAGHASTTTPPAVVGIPASCSDGENAANTAATVTPVSALDYATLSKFLLAARSGGTGGRLGLPEEHGCLLPQSVASSAEQLSPRDRSTRVAVEAASVLGTSAAAAADDALATGSPPASGERSRASSSASRLSPAAVSPLPLKPLNGTVQQLANAHDSIATAIPAANVAAFSEEAKVARARAMTPSTTADGGTPVAPTKVKVEPMADDVSPDALSSIGVVSGGNDGNSENRRSLSTPRRHVCSHCNIGFMYPTSFDAHVKFYCPSSRTASSVTATGN